MIISRASKQRAAQRLGSSTSTKRHDKANIDSIAQQALLLHQNGRVQEAEILYRKALSGDPKHLAVQHFLGLLLHQTGRGTEGLPLLENSVRTGRSNPDFLNNLGTVQLDHGRIAAAAKSFQAALAAKPDHRAARTNLGSAKKRLGDYDAAEKIFRSLITLNPFDKLARISLAETLQESGKPDDALVVLREALEMRPKDAELHFRLGVALMEKGDLGAAAGSFRESLSIDETLTEAWMSLSQVKRQERRDAELEAMERLHAQTPADSRDRMQLSFGLGKAHDDLKLYDKAFDFFQQGNSILRKSARYDEAATRADFSAMKAAFDETLFREKSSDKIADDMPIFIVGMPRSGTTLVEQIIASHPQVHGAGEVRYLQDIIDRHFPMEMPGGFPGGVTQLPKRAFSDAGKAYLDRIRKRYPDQRFVTDKMPGNFLLIGFIHLMVPNARIIHCVREPAATCLSIFKTHFRSGGHVYGYDLAELAGFYNLYVDMMEHWHRVLPGVVHDVRYEELVSDQDNQIRGLIDACGLPWDDACLDFHSNQRPVRTASVAQVRQPIYPDSVKLWTHYGDRLKPLLDGLRTRAN